MQERPTYEDMLRALGRYADRKGLKQICLLEVEGGMILQGSILVPTQEGYRLSLETEAFTHEDLEKLMGGNP